MGQDRERPPRGRFRAGRQARAHLSREHVVRAALAIVDRDGLDGFSMRKLGAELGVDPMAAYYYFPNKAAVLDGIVDAVTAEIVLPQDTNAPWDARLREGIRVYRNVLRAHPYALPVMSTHPSFSETSRRLIEGSAAILHDAGFTPAEALQIVGALAGYVIGATLAEVGVQPGDVPDPTVEEVSAQIEQLSPDDFPILRATYDSGIGWDPDAKFADGLEIFIAGLKARRGEFAHGTA